MIYVLRINVLCIFGRSKSTQPKTIRRQLVQRYIVVVVVVVVILVILVILVIIV